MNRIGRLRKEHIAKNSIVLVLHFPSLEQNLRIS